MVLNELGSKITAALAKVQNAEIIDDALLDACLKDISTALLQADVNVKQAKLFLTSFMHWPLGRRILIQPPMLISPPRKDPAIIIKLLQRGLWFCP